MSNHHNQGKPQGGNLNKPDPLERELVSGAANPAPAEDAATARAAAEQLAAQQAAAQEAAISGKAINNPVRMSEAFDTRELEIQDTGPIGLEEIRAKAHAALDSEHMIMEAAGLTEEQIKLERFMNEMVVITVHESPNEEDLPVVCPMVNGTGQPIVRGYPTAVKRKYVECLARAKETKYKQVQMDANDPSSLKMVPRTVLAYPFAIERDDNPNGRAWLRDIIRQQG
jgi:hypothetical protein